MDTEKKNEINNKFLAQNTENEDIADVDATSDSDDMDSIEVQDSVDSQWFLDDPLGQHFVCL